MTINKDFNVTGFNHSFYPYPLEKKITTSVKANNLNASQLAVRIEKEIHSFIQTAKTTKEVRHDPYKIIVYSKNKKKIN
ncbi:DUF4030 domain-containing protein [Fictibacillus enclensis]|uniref:DUF4030 domain-containing protein n=1 Tax=Fictibacillus enclensis TaxID=1017270 RepID=UPI003335D6B5